MLRISSTHSYIQTQPSHLLPVVMIWCIVPMDLTANQMHSKFCSLPLSRATLFISAPSKNCYWKFRKTLGIIHERFLYMRKLRPTAYIRPLTKIFECWWLVSWSLSCADLHRLIRFVLDYSIIFSDFILVTTLVRSG